MDIPNELIFGITTPPLSHPNTRRLKLKDPGCVRHKKCEPEQIYYQMDELHQNTSDPLSEKDKLITKQLIE